MLKDEYGGMRKRWHTNIVMLLLSVLVVGCIQPRTGEAPAKTYVLRAEEGTPETVSDPDRRDREAILLINQPQAEPGFDTPHMAYVKHPFEISYFSANQWADTPGRMLASLMVDKLEKAGPWRAVAVLPSGIRGDYRLDTQGVVLQQEFLRQPSQVRMALRLQLVELRGQTVLGARHFEAVESAPSEDAYGGVLAANRVVTKLLEEIASWLQVCLHNTKRGSC